MEHDLSDLGLVAAVGRHGSLTAAAAALGLTQPTVSYRLARVEARLGRALFRRGPGGAMPTEAGAILLAALEPALAGIGAALDEIAAIGRGPVLRVVSDFAFAGLWLMPRLGEFRARHPGIEVQVTARQVVPAPRAGEVAVRFARAGALGPEARLVLPERVLPVATPEMAGRLRDLAQATLLHLEAPSGAVWADWALWFAARGQSRPRRAGEIVLNTHDLVLQASMAGQGVALAWWPLVAGHLAEGRLVPVGPALSRPDHGYWLQSGGPGAAEAAFADWLCATTAGLVAEA